MSKLIAGIVALIIVAGGVTYVVIKKDPVSVAAITTFEECAAAGYPVMESYPERCATPDGRSFTKGVEEPLACTKDAFQCPDGSTVGRTGSKCQFFCPTPANSGIQGKVLVGPTCPVMENPPASDCADKPFQTNLSLITPDGRVARTFSSNANGEFKVSVSPGSYLVSSTGGDTGLTSCSKGGYIEVRANSYTQVTVNCDSGIR